MTYNDLKPKVDKLLVREELAGEIVESVQLFRDMVSAGWIEPIIDRHRCKLFLVEHIKQCVDRLQVEGYPTVSNKK